MRKARRRPPLEPGHLFRAPPQRPTREELPPPVVRRVTELLARLLREQHERVALRPHAKEVGHE